MEKDFINRKRYFAPASVEQMAARREARAAEQRELLAGGGENRCAVCIGMNIAGPNKRSGLIDAAFLDALACFIREAAAEGVLCGEFELRFINENTGIEALMGLDADAQKLKGICVRIEESHPAGRLFDMDVIAKNGVKLGRSEPRKCLICSENASVCARSRAHSVEELQNKTSELLKGFLIGRFADAAANALVSEVNITPKPGLVDRLNSGANSDMDASTFVRSAEALRPFFARMAELTIEFARSGKTDETSENFFTKLRKTGVAAEKAMLDATGGVNTHRGAIYSLGLLMSAAAHELMVGVFGADESGICGEPADGSGFIKRCIETAAAFARCLGDNSTASSNGAKMREKYGVEGPVQQAQQGFPLAMLAKNAKCEYYNRNRQADETLAWAYALIRVMAVMDDNNALRRGGEEGAAFVKKRASELAALALRVDSAEFNEALLELDAELIERNISCGGAADMLALALFLEQLEALFAPLCALLG